MTSVQVDASRLFLESYGGRVVAERSLLIKEQPRQRRGPRSGVDAEVPLAKARSKNRLCPNPGHRESPSAEVMFLESETLGAVGGSLILMRISNTIRGEYRPTVRSAILGVVVTTGGCR
jgi:hypothetical protein